MPPPRRERRSSEIMDLVRTLIERQGAADHLMEQERQGERWWRRLLKRLKLLS
jgi:hypothetical protein